MIDLQTISIMIAAISIAVAVCYYIIFLRITLRTRQAQLFMQTYVLLITPDRVRAMSDVLRWEFDDFNELLVKYLSNPEERAKFNTLILFYEGLGALVSEKLLPLRIVVQFIGGNTIRFWNLFHPLLDEMRDHIKHQTFASQTEYLYNELMKYKEKNPKSKHI